MDFEAAEANVGTTAVREGFEIDAGRLHEWMQGNVDGYAGNLTVEQFRGGQSNPTYKLTAGGTSYVLRRKPPGELLKSAHAVDREYKVMTALGQTDVPVPRTYALCTDDDVIGTWFYVMEFLEGRVIWDLNSGPYEPRDRAELWDAANDAIARLHKADYQAIGLSDFGRPGNYVARQFKRWAGQYEYTRDALDNPALDALVEWIPDNIPEDDSTTVVHGDLQFANMMFHPDRNEVIALLDWELSTLGNPLSDFAYFVRHFRLPGEGGLKDLDHAAMGIPSEADYLATYCRRTGRTSVDNWDFYIVFNFFRIAAILQGIAKRVKDGTAASDHAITAGEGAVPMAEAAWALAQTL